ncbi:MAG: threonine--tRNA ligase [Acidobacteria bacterium]|nr:threonine--tRNA ligase [Acidobacteriota bacterium]
MSVTVRLPDGKATEVSGAQSAFETIAQVDPALAKASLVARMDSRLVDLSTVPREGSTIEPVTNGDPEALEVYRHSSAHLLAAAVLELFPGAKLGIGPALMNDPKGGFFYDFKRDEPFTPEDLASIEERMRALVKKNLPYRRIEMGKAEALERFSQDELKCHLIGEKGDAVASFYTLGDHFIDFCRGPHIPSAGRIRAFKLLSVAGAYWLGDEKGPPMQRIYGQSFFTREEMEDWLKQREEAEKRDHRRLGRELDLFSIQDEYGAGLVFWHPKGGLIRRAIEDFTRDELERRGYGLVFTPHIAQHSLWVKSGHANFYSDAMYAPMAIDEIEYQLKPMNCPFHIGIFAARQHSYRDLPIRLAELGTVYRYERSGVMHGLMRVRGFTQDDAHHFCTPEQARAEVLGCLEFALHVYRTFGFQYTVELSVRDPKNPAKYLGDDAMWSMAEENLALALEELALPYQRMEGEAAFYGPKIDIKVVDAIGRAWQLGTVQFDFNLPERFRIEYIGEDNRPHRPIMIHRALFGSLERFFGILVEHFAGAFPLWLAPVQVSVLPITEKQNDYAQRVREQLSGSRLRAEADLRGEKIGAKIRHAQLQKVPFMLVCGAREAESDTVAVRERHRGDLGAMRVDEFAARARSLVEARSLELNL